MEEKTSEVADVEAWELAGPFPDRLETRPRTVQSGWDEALVRSLVAHQGRGLATEGMHCVAREIGRFELEHRAQPAGDLRDFIIGRCGAAVSQVAFTSQVVVGLEDGDNVDTLLESSREGIDASVASLLEGMGQRELGIWFGRKDDRGLVLIAAGERHVDVEPLSLVPGESNRIRIRGRISRPVAEVYAVIGRGRYGSAECTVDERVVLPAFSLECEAGSGHREIDGDADGESGDRSGDTLDRAPLWIEVFTSPEGRVLSHLLLGVLLRPGGEASPTYRRPAMGRELPAGTDLVTGFLSALNEVRAEANLRPVLHANAQTAVAERMAPHFFAAHWGLHPQELADTIAIGLLAGWQVDGRIRYGKLTSAWVGHSDDPRRLLASTLNRPSGRAVLLDPEAGAVSIGTMSHSRRKLLGAVINTYALFDEETQESRTARIAMKIAMARAERKLVSARRSERYRDQAAHAVSLIENRGKTPNKAMKTFLSDAVQASRLSAMAFVDEVASLDEFEVPEALLGTVAPTYEVAVAYHRPEGEPWGRYVILLLVVGGVPT